MTRLHYSLCRGAGASLLAVSALMFSGCEAERGDAIPASAVLRSEGNGPTVTYTTDLSGTGYVYDVTDNKLVWSGTVSGGQMVTVDTHRDVVKVDDRIVHEKDIHEGHRYRIFVDHKIRE